MEATKMRVVSAVFLAAVSVFSFCWPKAASAQGKAQKLSQNLVDRAKDTLRKVKETENQVRAVTERYDKLLARKSVEDRRNEHKQVAEELGNLEDRAKEVRERTREMEEEANKFFTEWAKGLDDIGDTELRFVSRDRLSETQKGYGEIVAAGRLAADEYDVFVSALRNHLNYLKLDMSDEAVKKLKSGDQNFRGKLTVLHARIRDLMETIERYVKAMS